MERAATLSTLPLRAQISHLPKFAWAVLIYNVAVVLWGALVRATKAGAGCGGHWPLCNGMVLPETMQAATRIEFTHRIMSGLAFIAVVALYVWARREFRAGHLARKCAGLALTFIVIEALLGAGLVLFGYVAEDNSTGRIYALALHLINTFLLLGSLALAARYSSGFTAPAGPIAARVYAALAAVVTVAVAGAITALGDTLFPVGSLAAGLQTNVSAAADFLVRLRVIHPLLAVVTTFFMAAVVWPVFRRTRSASATALLLSIFAAPAIGGMTILLRAPVWSQLLHLLAADCVWIALVLFADENRSA